MKICLVATEEKNVKNIQLKEKKKITQPSALVLHKTSICFIFLYIFLAFLLLYLLFPTSKMELKFCSCL